MREIVTPCKGSLSLHNKLSFAACAPRLMTPLSRSSNNNNCKLIFVGGVFYESYVLMSNILLSTKYRGGQVRCKLRRSAFGYSQKRRKSKIREAAHAAL